MGSMRSKYSARKIGTSGRLIAAAFLCITALTPSIMAQVSSYGDKETGPRNDKPPAILNGVVIEQHLNQQLPLDLTFTDDMGKPVQLASYFGNKPAVLALVYYQCPMLCSEELNGLTGALEMVDEVPGRDFNVIIISIDPSEGTDLAAAKKRTYLRRYGHPETANGWHFMTGTQANIDALTKAVGFGYVKIPGPDGKLTQFAHASSIQLAIRRENLRSTTWVWSTCPSAIWLGPPKNNHIGSKVDNILTYCYHYDPQTNKHSLIIARVVQLGGAVTVILLGGFMWIMFRRDYRQAHDQLASGTKVNG